MPNQHADSFDTGYERAEAALVVPDLNAHSPMPMRFSGDGIDGFAGLLHPGERLVLTRQAVALRGTFRIGFSSSQSTGLRCGLLAGDGSVLVAASCSPGVGNALDYDGTAVSAAAFIEGAAEGGAELDDVSVSMDQLAPPPPCSDGLRNGKTKPTLIAAAHALVAATERRASSPQTAGAMGASVGSARVRPPPAPSRIRTAAPSPIWRRNAQLRHMSFSPDMRRRRRHRERLRVHRGERCCFVRQASVPRAAASRPKTTVAARALSTRAAAARRLTLAEAAGSRTRAGIRRARRKATPHFAPGSPRTAARSVASIIAAPSAR